MRGAEVANAIKSEFPSQNDCRRIFVRAVVVLALLTKIDPTSVWITRFKHLLTMLPTAVLAKAASPRLVSPAFLLLTQVLDRLQHGRKV